MRSHKSGFYRRRDGTERLWFSPEDIEVMMEAELLRLGLLPTAEKPAVDIERFIQGLGVRMDQYAKLDPTVLGLTEFYADKPPKIFINSDLTGAIEDDETPPGIRGRWRATVAHEGSHVVMHRLLFEVSQYQEGFFQVEESSDPQRLMRCLKKNVLFRGGGVSDWREVQANMGTAALLMPQRVFRRFADDVAKEHRLETGALIVGSAAAVTLTAKMAALFDVSRRAAGIRLETLGIVSPAGQPWLVQ